MSKRVNKPDRGLVSKFNGRDQMRMNDLQYRGIKDALVKHDYVVSEYENKWGVDRLQELVPSEMRDRFYQQRDKLNAAIEANDGKDVQHQVQVMCRAYVALEKKALEDGMKPLTGEYWETPLPDGRVLAIAKTFAEAGKVARDNRELVVYSLEEIANFIGAEKKKLADQINKVKEVFPGAAVTSVTPAKDMIDDEIPF